MPKVIVCFFVLTLLPCVLCQFVKPKFKPIVKNLNLTEGSECLSSGYNGICVSAYKCLSVLVGIKSNYYPPLCTFDGDVPIVCCGNCELVDDIRVATFIPELGVYYRNRPGISHRKCLQYLEELPYSCKGNGLSLEYDFDRPNRLPDDKVECSRLFVFGGWTAIDGVDAMRGEFPHMALLGYGTNLDSAQYQCGGSVISERYILTAAHCISSAQLGPVKYVALGILKRTDPPELWQRYTVKRIIGHPEYKSPSKYHDIALLEVEPKIKFDPTVLPACLSTEKHDYYEEASSDDFFKTIRQALKEEKKDTYATGWGRIGENRLPADTLQKVKLDRYKDEECSRLYQKHRHLTRGYDNATQMCFGDYTGRADTCSVTVRANVFECQFRVVGVVSSGNPCGSKGGAGLYTRVEHYLPWIESIVWHNEKL